MTRVFRWFFQLGDLHIHLACSERETYGNINFKY